MHSNQSIDQNLSREEKYRQLLPQVAALTGGEPNLIANLANVSAVLHTTFGFHWVGFYLVDGDELVLGPFQGPVACTRLQRGKGVCAAAWEAAETVIVEDVDAFPGHIACSSFSRSEIVVPLFNADNEVLGVLDVDSEHLADFSDIDRDGLEAIVNLLNSRA